ncbi:MAG: MFS transporter, partial [Asticcacaulis sp.]|nr:MFS transporter [Asticcacaulis sp.]
QVLVRRPGLVLLIVAVACLQASHSFYYGFSNILWKAQGLSTSTCAWLWGLAVSAEVVFMLWGERLRRRIGPWRMLVIAGVLAVVRWSAMAFAPPLWLLIPLQVLHIFSFAAVYFAGLELVYRLAPKGYEGLAQTTNAAYSNGVMMGLGTLASGAAYQAWGAGGYGVMAAVAGLGLACAGWLYLNRERYMAG